MGRYQPSRNVQLEDKDEFHPIWRGVGCILVLVVPALAFGLTTLLLQSYGSKFQIPAQFIVPPSWPGWNILPKFMYTPNILVILLGTIALTVAMAAILTLITFIIFKFFGPSRYGPTDMPPVQRQIKKRFKKNS